MKKYYNQKVLRECPFCGSVYHVNVNSKEYCEWLLGGLIQNVMKEMPIHDRESLISGICQVCQKEMDKKINEEN
jgi:ssDNA-binding Zn-finger/Zn-ribbon topoisomerase 1